MTEENPRSSFFDPDDFTTWKKEWQDMPEFVQENLRAYQSIMVHFETEEDRKEFAELVKQFISKDTIYIWFPKIERLNSNTEYIDEP